MEAYIINLAVFVILIWGFAVIKVIRMIYKARIRNEPLPLEITANIHLRQPMPDIQVGSVRPPMMTAWIQDPNDIYLEQKV